MSYSPPPQDRLYLQQQIPPDVQGASTTALILEIIFGFFGLLGIGHAYSGRLLVGGLLLVGWWIFIGLGTLISSITFGIGACIFGPLYIAGPIISGIQARTYVQREYSRGSWSNVIGLAGGGCLAVVAISVILILIFGLGIFSLDTISKIFPQ